MPSFQRSERSGRRNPAADGVGGILGILGCRRLRTEYHTCGPADIIVERRPQHHAPNRRVGKETSEHF
jgi:hypothetical protein